MTIGRKTSIMIGSALFLCALNALAASTFTVNIINNSSSASFIYLDSYAISPSVFNRLYKDASLPTRGQASPYYTITSENTDLLSGNLVLQPSVNGKVQSNIYCNIGIYNNAPKNSCYNGCSCTITSQGKDFMTVTIDYITTTSSQKRI